MSDESPEVSEAMEKFYEDWWDRQRRGEDADEIQAKKIQDQMTETESLRKTITELSVRADDAEAKLSTAENIVGQLRDQQAKVRADWTLLSEKHGHAKDYHSILVRTHDEAMSRAGEWEAYAESLRDAGEWVIHNAHGVSKSGDSPTSGECAESLQAWKDALAQFPKSSLARRDAKVLRDAVKRLRDIDPDFFGVPAREIERMAEELDKGGE